MNKHIISLIVFLLIFYSSYAQTLAVTFKKRSDAHGQIVDKDTVQRESKELIHPVTLLIDEKNIPESDRYKYEITVKSEQKTNLSTAEYKLNFNSTTLDKTSKEYTFYIIITASDHTDIERSVYLSVSVSKIGATTNENSATASTSHELVVFPSKSLNTYNYLAYVGTNFDLVDGVQAKNLFFATNLMSAPVRKRGFGFSLTLYGNRTTTSTDTSGRTTYTSKAVPIGGDSARFYMESGIKTINRVSDNLGASFSPLIRLFGHLSDPEHVVQLYYAPQFEFIWRRTTITTRYTDVQLVDSIDRADRPFSGPIILTDPVLRTPINIYDIYLGLIGVLMNHENKFVSVRIQVAIGWNFSYTSGRGTGLTRGGQLATFYTRTNQPFFFTRAWITEPVSGITIGAEVSNTLFMKEKAQPYYNVTLSKAINLSSLASIFQPVTTR